ncbi:MAG: hypothetical protein LBL62_00165 [Planctomycetaceae bacterium]|nr:hypothetical protein [Planctomycetaceae bacterium]
MNQINDGKIMTQPARPFSEGIAHLIKKVAHLFPLFSVNLCFAFKTNFSILCAY